MADIPSSKRIPVYNLVECPNSLAGKNKPERCRPVYKYCAVRMEEGRKVSRQRSVTSEELKITS